jgi:hypothetical protein
MKERPAEWEKARKYLRFAKNVDLEELERMAWRSWWEPLRLGKETCREEQEEILDWLEREALRAMPENRQKLRYHLILTFHRLYVRYYADGLPADFCKDRCSVPTPLPAKRLLQRRRRLWKALGWNSMVEDSEYRWISWGGICSQMQSPLWPMDPDYTYYNNAKGELEGLASELAAARNPRAQSARVKRLTEATRRLFALSSAGYRNGPEGPELARRVASQMGLDVDSWWRKHGFDRMDMPLLGFDEELQYFDATLLPNGFAASERRAIELTFVDAVSHGVWRGENTPHAHRFLAALVRSITVKLGLGDTIPDYETLKYLDQRERKLHEIYTTPPAELSDIIARIDWQGWSLRFRRLDLDQLDQLEQIAAWLGLHVLQAEPPDREKLRCHLILAHLHLYKRSVAARPNPRSVLEARERLWELLGWVSTATIDQILESEKMKSLLATRVRAPRPYDWCVAKDELVALEKQLDGKTLKPEEQHALRQGFAVLVQRAFCGFSLLEDCDAAADCAKRVAAMLGLDVERWWIENKFDRMDPGPYRLALRQELDYLENQVIPKVVAAKERSRVALVFFDVARREVANPGVEFSQYPALREQIFRMARALGIEKQIPPYENLDFSEPLRVCGIFDYDPAGIEELRVALFGEKQAPPPAELVSIEQQLDQFEPLMGKGTPAQEEELGKQFIDAIARAFFYRATCRLPTEPVLERMERARKASRMDTNLPGR